MKHQRIGGLTFFVLMLVLAQYMSTHQFPTRSHKYDEKTLGYVGGHTTHTGFSHSRYGSRETTYGIELVYYYEVDGTTYRSFQRIPGGQNNSRYMDESRWTTSRFVVLYDPKNPSNSTILIP